jgi:hypothetical protein
MLDAFYAVPNILGSRGGFLDMIESVAPLLRLIHRCMPTKLNESSDTSMRAPALCLVVLAACLTACDQKDPGMQAELIQLKAERTQLTNRVQELENAIQDKNDEIDTLSSRVSENDKGDAFDKQASMTSFIAKVTELKSEVQREFPEAQLSDSVQMPAFDAPLQSEVRIDVSRPGQAVKSLLWIGRGKLTGEWVFSQRHDTTLAAAPAGGQPVAEVTTNPPATPPGGSAAGTGPTTGVSEKKDPAPPGQAQPSDIPPGSRLVREDAQGKVWLTPDGRYIIKLKY